MAIGTAFKAFFAILLGGEKAETIEQILAGSTPVGLPEPGQQAPTLSAPSPVAKASEERRHEKERSDALSLLSALQRESRLIDLVQEPLEQFTDAQVGAAARPCLKQCQQLFERMFALKPVLEGEEGQTIVIPPKSSPMRIQWVGAAAASEVKGTLIHHGWEASRCEVGKWIGDKADAMVVAPAQIQE